ncbi:hypothetical protein EAI_03954 [Harpegnathos saltator]|uniref:Uncharacterized protein n=1 Tax=Harpegnathos saltator TaxID=610380 RepID=E2BLA7_HARSA|nr:hypothetical protein EAI_03954 [Harpegnathos saltator]
MAVASAEERGFRPAVLEGSVDVPSAPRLLRILEVEGVLRSPAGSALGWSLVKSSEVGKVGIAK